MINQYVWTVIVTYSPDVSALKKLCNTIVAAGANVVIVDNTESSYPHLMPSGEKIKLISLGFNSGISHAQNIGISFALNSGGKMIVFFDQDSIISDSYLGALLADIEDPNELVVRCPVIYDAESGFEYPFVVVSKWGFSSKIYASKSSQPVQISFGISSGSVVSASVFDQVGMFNEMLFIDYVDTEWFLRCGFHSIPVIAQPRATLDHRIGNFSKQHRFLKIHIHSPARVYYQVRNSIALLRISHIAIIFSVREIAATLIHKTIQTFYVERKLDHLRLIFKGIFHGLSGKLGSISRQTESN